ncbi:hypothetical protein ARMGADRAFT_1090394 [Armillaria gallica]|uniref:Uncharacterized protein n=1 Tax=Armillaria gallica TaxID=47427 RepID=A0A2H3CGW8_ARMGA|nr:hypothetical protein ARMGADRAFT_1090394 [Armillaria gallica]
MSSIVVQTRGRCIQITDSQLCWCPRFFPPEPHLLDQTICGQCGHSIHAHVDLVSLTVFHHPARQCASYAQQSLLMYTCTCGAPFAEHNPTHKSHHIPALWTVVRIFYPEIYGPFPSDTTGNYSNDAPNSFSPNTTSSDYNTVISSGNARNVSLTAASTSSHSAASTLSAIQHDTIQTLGYSSDGYPAQYPSHAGPPESGATNESLKYQDYGDAMHPEPPEGSSGSYGT